MSNDGLQSVIGAAIVDRGFRARLLEDPPAALKGFQLTASERKLASSIRVGTLEEYAGRLEMALSGGSPRLSWATRPTPSWPDQTLAATG